MKRSQMGFIAVIIIAMMFTGFIMGLSPSFTTFESKENDNDNKSSTEDNSYYDEGYHGLSIYSSDDYNSEVTIMDAKAGMEDFVTFNISDCKTMILEPSLDAGSQIQISVKDNVGNEVIKTIVDSNKTQKLDLDLGEYELYAESLKDGSNGNIIIRNEWVKYSSEAMDWIDWDEKETGKAAAEDCNFKDFMAAEGVNISIGSIWPKSYKSCGTGTRADISIGDVSIIILKAWAVGDDDFFVYCDSYPYKTIFDVDGKKVVFYGDKTGEFSKAEWGVDDIEYKILIFKSDKNESVGLNEEDIRKLVSAVK